MKPPEQRRPPVRSRRPSQPQSRKPNPIRASPPTQHAGRRTFGQFLGTALRHARAAVAMLTTHGIGARALRETLAARNALDSALWLGEYIEGDDDATR